LNASPRDVVARYHEAWRRKDFESARELLADDLRFSGPFDTFDNADDLVAALRELAPISRDAEVHKVFEDGDDVCVLFDLVTNTPIGSAPVAEWHTVRDDKIAAIRVYFDARPFAALREGGQAGR
jgi:ketosteroid isomerase-like protein